MELIKYNPEIHKMGHTYWEYDGRPTHRPVKFMWLCNEETDEIYVVKVDARHYCYMINFGGCYSNIYISSVATRAVHQSRLFKNKEDAQKFAEDRENRSCWGTMLNSM